MIKCKIRRKDKMDIRIINRDGELINVSRLSLKVIGRSLIGINEKQEVVNVESYGSEEEAREVLKKIVDFIWIKHKDNNSNAIIINLGENKE